MSFYGQRTCKKNVIDPVNGTVTGKIPEWLKGSLIRNGGGAYEVGPDKYNHVFDGLALIHKFNISNGSVTYQNRFLQSDTYKRNMAAQRIVVSEFGTTAFPDPCKSLYQRFSSMFSFQEFTDNDLVNFTKYADDIYTCSEINFIRKIDVKTLETLDKVNISNYVSVHGATAHPHYGNDGTVYNIGSGRNGTHPSYKIIKFPKKENDLDMFQNASVICSVPSRYHFHTSYHHSFGMSENYAILIEQPYMISLLGMATSNLRNKPFSDSINFYPKELTYFYIINIKTGKKLATTYVSESFMFFHQINAYEKNDHIIIDLCCYDDDTFVKVSITDMNKMLLHKFKCLTRRYILPLHVSKSEKVNTEENLVKLQYSKAKAFLQRDGKIMCHYEILTPEEVTMTELPTINYNTYNGKPYQYFYGIAYISPVKERCMIKVDIKNKTILKWHEENASPSESVFVQKPNSTAEDDGVILFSVLYDDNDQKVSLVILDAQNFNELARADFLTESIIPPDFHGMFVKN